MGDQTPTAPVDDPFFVDVWKNILPDRGSSNNPRVACLRAWNATLKRIGPTDDNRELLRSAAKRYRVHCDAKRFTSTERAMRGSTFYGRDEPWRQEFKFSEEERNGTTTKGWRSGADLLGEDAESIIDSDDPSSGDSDGITIELQAAVR